MFKIKKSMEAYNVLKIVDIEPLEFNNDFLIWLVKEIHPEFTDTDETFGEHIYNVNSIVEQTVAIENVPECYESQIEELERLLTQNEAGYFRIVN